MLEIFEAILFSAVDAAAEQPDQSQKNQKLEAALPVTRSSTDSGAKSQPASQAPKPPLDRRRSEEPQPNLKPTPEQAMLANGHSQGGHLFVSQQLLSMALNAGLACNLCLVAVCFACGAGML